MGGSILLLDLEKGGKGERGRERERGNAWCRGQWKGREGGKELDLGSFCAGFLDTTIFVLYSLAGAAIYTDLIDPGCF